MNRLVAIVGPTGIGKSRLALHLAAVFNGEIVSADSRQVYRHLNIGTDKPTPQELAQVPHHLIDVANPDEDFSLARYQSLACRAIDDIHRRGRLPFLVGGSGLYVWSVLEGWRVPAVAPDPELRRRLEERARNDGVEVLYEELLIVDPEAARKTGPCNLRRIIRALEVYQKTETPFSETGSKQAPAFGVLIIGLTAERAELYRRIDRRVDEMVARGLVGEVEKLMEMGYDLYLPAMSGIGYRQIGECLRGEIMLDDALRKIRTETHRFARHQYAWFRLNDERIHWVDIMTEADSEVARAVKEFVEGK
jgi:tRNA dimethylallyltransferase